LSVYWTGFGWSRPLWPAIIVVSPYLLPAAGQQPAAVKSSAGVQRAAVAAVRASVAAQLSQTRTAMEKSVARQRAGVAGSQIPRLRTSGQSYRPVGLRAGVCQPIDPIQVSPLLNRIAGDQNLSPGLLAAMIQQESAFDPCAISTKGAVGLMQLMPATVEQFQIRDPFDPVQNIESGARYMRQLLDRYGGDLALALAAYNAGPAQVDNSNGLPQFPETVKYVSDLLKKLGMVSAAPPR
jgi:soluble lytic murein transglycosylase-like protein